MATRWEQRDHGDYREDRPRRRMDDIREERDDRDWTDRFAGSIERGWDRAREAARNVTDRDRDGRRGMAEWNDNDRNWGGRPRRDITRALSRGGTLAVAPPVSRIIELPSVPSAIPADTRPPIRTTLPAGAGTAINSVSGRRRIIQAAGRVDTSAATNASSRTSATG